MPDFYDNDLELENNVEYAGDTLSPQEAYLNANGEVGRYMATGNSDEALMAEHGLNMNGAIWGDSLADKILDIDFGFDYLTKYPELYNNLPLIFQKQLTIEDVAFSGDGYFLCKKTLSEMIEGMGINEETNIGYGVDKEGKPFNVTSKSFDDWYLSGIVNNDGEVTYSLVKMREPGDIHSADGSAVSFVELDIDSCSKSLEGIINGTSKEDDLKDFYSELDKVMTGRGAEANEELLEYFSDPESEGSYTIANLFINKYLAEGKVNENGDYVLPDDVRYDKQVKQCQKKLDELANEGIYDKENNTIHIQDKDNLTDDEKSAIMIMLTGNPDIYSYAAENQYHAIKYMQNFFKSHAIVSDAGVGEAESWMGKQEERHYKNDNGKYYVQQVSEHK